MPPRRSTPEARRASPTSRRPAATPPSDRHRRLGGRHRRLVGRRLHRPTIDTGSSAAGVTDVSSAERLCRPDDRHRRLGGRHRRVVGRRLPPRRSTQEARQASPTCRQAQATARSRRRARLARFSASTAGRDRRASRRCDPAPITGVTFASRHTSPCGRPDASDPRSREARRALLRACR